MSSSKESSSDLGAPVGMLDPADAETRAQIDALMVRAELASGHAGLSEPSRLAWAGSGGEFVGLVLRQGDTPTGYAHLSWRDRSWTIEVVLDPDHGRQVDRPLVLLRSAVAIASRRDAAEVRYWANQHHAEDESELETLGFAVERDLLQMRVPLPLTVVKRPLDEAFSLRPFRPGVDDSAWLEVNNRAFAAHPEQGHWDLETLVEREHTAWFDPDGFILCESDGRLAGSCWTKLHGATDPPLGEIYVISVDPNFQQRGLGRALTVAGLDWLAKRVSTGMLYVDGDNEGAVTLYRGLGFTVDHVDRCYLLTID